MRTPDTHASTRRHLGRAVAAGLLALTATGLTAGTALAAQQPQPRDANGNLSNIVTSTSPGANCVTGTEPGCSTVLDTPMTPMTPMFTPGAEAGEAGLAAAALGLALLRRRAIRNT